jgi:hypothetical protein
VASAATGASATPSAARTAPAAPVTGVTVADIYVSPTGDDRGDGTIGHPYASLAKAVSVVRPGQTIALRGGTYRPTAPVVIATNGTAGKRITVSNYRSERPVIDAGRVPADKWYVTQRASFWTVQGLEIRNAANHAYVCLSCRSDVFRRLSIHDSGNTALMLRGENTVDNQILDSDFFRNHDDAGGGEGADGVAVKYGSGAGNVIRGCRAYQNSDDGVDLGEFTSPVTVDTTWAYGNGVNRWNIADFAGDGAGFKLGGGSPAAPARHVVTGSAAWDNGSFGFTENGNAGSLTLRNDTAFRNGAAGFAFANSSSTLQRNLALGNAGTAGDAWLGSAVVATGNSWNQAGWSPAALRSTDPTTAQGPRRADGSLPATAFLTNTRDPAVGARMPGS